LLWFRKEPTQALPPELLLDDVEPPELLPEEVELPELLDEVPEPEPPDDPPPPQAVSSDTSRSIKHARRNMVPPSIAGLLWRSRKTASMCQVLATP
jgi:hypothetical protein